MKRVYIEAFYYDEPCDESYDSEKTSLVRWGSGRGLKVEWEEDEGTNKRGKGSEEEKNGRRNPIIISSQQGYVPCTKLLHRFGYCTSNLFVQSSKM